MVIQFHLFVSSKKATRKAAAKLNFNTPKVVYWLLGLEDVRKYVIH